MCGDPQRDGTLLVVWLLVLAWCIFVVVVERHQARNRNVSDWLYVPMMAVPVVVCYLMASVSTFKYHGDPNIPTPLVHLFYQATAFVAYWVLVVFAFHEFEPRAKSSTVQFV